MAFDRRDKSGEMQERQDQKDSEGRELVGHEEWVSNI